VFVAVQPILSPWSCFRVSEEAGNPPYPGLSLSISRPVPRLRGQDLPQSHRDVARMHRQGPPPAWDGPGIAPHGEPAVWRQSV